ncbi:hypothetical protein AAG906_019666 [Vitis piasezkii]
MATHHIIKRILLHPPSTSVRFKTTSVQYVASRARDPTFEKLMDNYKNLLKVVSIQDLILANPKNPTVSLQFLSNLSQKLHLNRGAASFLRKYPHIFHVFYDPSKSLPFCKLTDAAVEISRLEAAAIRGSMPIVVDRLVRLLSMSTVAKSLPLRAIFKVWRELGLPDDFEDSVILQNPHLFKLCDGNEPNTHVLKLVSVVPSGNLRAAVENWRIMECCKEDCGSSVDPLELRFSFKHGFPPGMRLGRTLRPRLRSGRGCRILTVEKTVEVEKISHFRKWFEIDLNIRDLFLDHPGMFYLSTKGKRHTVFLREAYERGCLIDPNPVYDAKRKLLDLVVLGRHRLFSSGSTLQDMDGNEEGKLQEEGGNC